LVLLFSALVAVPLVISVAWLGITAHRSVVDAGRALTDVADESLQKSGGDVARLAAGNAANSSKTLVRIAHRSLTGYADREIKASEETLRQSASHLTQTGTAAMEDATERIAVASARAVGDANDRLRHKQQQALGDTSKALINASRHAFDRIGTDLTADSEDLVIRLARDLTTERSRNTKERIQQFIQSTIEAITQVAQEPRMRSDDPYIGGRLRQLVEQHRVILFRAQLLDESGKVISQWPPPFSPTAETAELPPVAAAALTSDQPEISPVQFGPADLLPQMSVAVALRSTNGPATNQVRRDHRVLVATLSLDMLSHLLSSRSLGDSQPAPVFVMTPEGRVLAHSEVGSIGSKFVLPSTGVTKQIQGDSVLFESNVPGHQRVLTAATEIRRPPLVVVAVQPLGHLLAQIDELRRTVHTTAVGAANEMAREADTRAASMEKASAEEQRRVASETAVRVRQERQKLAETAVTALVRQQSAIAHQALERMKEDSTNASTTAGREMVQRADLIAQQSSTRIRDEAAYRAHLGLIAMHELAGQTAAAAAGRMITQSSGILAVALLAALLAALLTAQSAVRPITALAAGARSIARGDFSHRVPITTEDELGQLAQSFNHMATSIEASRAELEASNEILAQEKRRIQAIVDNSPDGLLILNQDGSVGYANPVARSLLPWRDLPLAGENVLLETALPRSLVQSLGEALETIDSGRVSVCDLVLEDPDTTWVEAPGRSVPERHSAGGASAGDGWQDGTLGLTVDKSSSEITAVPGGSPPRRRRVLQVRSVALGTASAGVGRLVHLHDVTREREIDEMKSNFVTLVSHELRTPLTSILGFSSYMLLGKMGPLTEPQRSGLESIERQAQRLKAIASDFLDLSRIEAGRLEMRREPVDMSRVARRVLEELTPQARERGLWLRLSPRSRGPAIALGDEQRIAQIFTNLVHNGIKFTERGGVEVTILPQAELVRVEVRDTGIGIPEEEQDRIFDRFYQVERLVSRKAGGTGLGLSIVKHLVEALGGELGVQSFARSEKHSSEGRMAANGGRSTDGYGDHPEGGIEGGTMFYFTVPAMHRASDATVQPSKASSPVW
jgi:signal transduction histidine kinase